jgi:hypothetical protein
MAAIDSALNDPCLLCEIAAEREEASTAYEDEHVIAVMDLHPVTQGHLFVFPRAHAGSLEALNEDLGAHLFQVVHRLARALYRSGLPCEGRQHVPQPIGTGQPRVANAARTLRSQDTVRQRTEMHRRSRCEQRMAAWPAALRQLVNAWSG